MIVSPDDIVDFSRYIIIEDPAVGMFFKRLDREIFLDMVNGSKIGKTTLRSIVEQAVSDENISTLKLDFDNRVVFIKIS